MNRKTQLRTLFLHLTTVGLAAVAAGCALSPSDFETNVCADNPLTGVTPAKAVDYMELRTTYKPSYVGIACGGAKDKAVCQAALSKLIRNDVPSFDQAGPRYLVYTRGDEVGSVASAGELRSFLAPFENAADGALLLSGFTEHRFSCDGSNARASGDGFEFLTRTGGTCGEGTLNANAVYIDPRGNLSVRQTAILAYGDSDCIVGRRPEGFAVNPAFVDSTPIGGYLAMAAELEAASVPAFRRLARELRAHGAPEALVARARAAAEDEVKHARSMRRLAKRFGGTPRAPKVGKLATRSLVDIAIENAREGCVRETFGALVATYQAHHSTDAEVRAELRVIARDETEHAALAWDIADWIASRLTKEERDAVGHAQALAEDDLRADLSRETFSSSVLGLPSSGTSLGLLREMTENLQLAA
ncbi:MAG: ferritin-like domain-containing protein [Polyangiaceae bacterium]|nr:ferritin-like domain-containing protein [Polyangiaceae bacterium]